MNPIGVMHFNLEAEPAETDPDLEAYGATEART